MEDLLKQLSEVAQTSNGNVLRLTRSGHPVAPIECEKVIMFDSRRNITGQCRDPPPALIHVRSAGEEQKLLGCLNELYHSIRCNVLKLLHDSRGPADFHKLRGFVRP